MDTKKLRQKILDLAIHGKLVPPVCRQAGKILTMNPEPPIKGKKCWFTYVIECEDGSFYKGYTDDLLRRYKQHCDGNGAEYTKKHKPKQLYYWEMHYTQENALNREKYLKSGIGREWFKREVVDKPENFEPASVLLERIRAEKERLIKEGKIKKSKASKTSDTPHYEKVPFEVPSSWEGTTLENILELVSGQDFPPEKYNANVSGIPYIIGASNIVNEQLVINRWTEYPSVYSYLNDLLVVCKGSGIGKMAINNIGTVHIARQIQAVRVYTNYINIRYIKAVIKNNIENIISKANGLIPGLKRELLLSLQIPLPPFPEQQRIVAEIEKCFALIDIIENGKADLQTTIKQAKNKILDLAIHGKLVSQDPNDEPASELLKRINPKAEITCDNGHYQNLLFELPCNWSWATLFEVTEFIRNGAQIKQIKGAAGIPITRIETISDSELNLSRMGYSDIFDENEYSNYYLQEGDILMSHINSRIHVGKCALCRNIPYKIIHGMNLLRICLKKEILPEYITLFFRTNIFYIQIDPYIKNAVNQASINITNLQKTLIPIPPLPEQKRIVDGVNKTFAKLDAIMENL